MLSAKVAVILPSRGLIFSQTAQEILANLKGIPHKIYFSHARPIPDCFETPTQEALKDKDITHLWFVEDDMELTNDILQKMLDMGKAVVTVDYPTTEYGGGAMFKVKGQVIFCGTGCTLVKREVFEELTKPYFRTDICWNIKNYGDFLKIIAVPRGDSLEGYGLHDVNFCMNLYRKGIPIHDLGITVGQRKLVRLGKSGSNKGTHKIKIWRKIKKDDLLEKVQKWPIEPRGNMATVVANDGKELMVTHDHAETLVGKGLATKPPKRYIVVDDSEAGVA